MTLALVLCWLGAFATERAFANSDTAVGEPPAGEISHGEKRTPASADGSEKFLHDKFQEAKRHYRDGHYQLAFRMADAILLLAPNCSFRRELKQFRREAEGRWLGASVLYCHFERDAPSADDGFPARSIKGHLIIENISGSPVTLGRGEESQPIGQVRFTVSEIYGDGTGWSYTGIQNVDAPGRIELKDGERHELPLDLKFPSGANDPVLQSYDVQGSLRPSLIEAGKRQILRAIPLQKVVEYRVPKDLVNVTKDPLKSLKIAILSGDVRMLVAAGYVWYLQLQENGVVSAPEREKTIDLLLASLDGSKDAVRNVLMRLLEKYTGVRRPHTVTSWKIWAMSRTKRSADEPARSP